MKWLVEFEGVDLDGPMSRCGFRAIDYAGKVRYVSNSQDMVVPCPLFLRAITERVMYNIGAWYFLTILVSLHHIIQVQGLSYFLPVSLMENDGQ